MADLTVTVPDAAVARIRTAFTTGPHQDEFTRSGLSPANFVLKKVKDFIRDQVCAAEAISAAETARDAAVAAAKAAIP